MACPTLSASVIYGEEGIMNDKEYNVEAARNCVREAESRVREAQSNLSETMRMDNALIEQRKSESDRNRRRAEEELERGFDV